jgi:hypothetical protein
LGETFGGKFGGDFGGDFGETFRPGESLGETLVGSPGDSRFRHALREGSGETFMRVWVLGVFGPRDFKETLGFGSVLKQ